MTIKISSQIADIKFDGLFINASGVHCQLTSDLDELQTSGFVAGVVTKSATIAARAGNPAPRYVDLAHGSINSMGLPNQGFDYYLNYALTNPEKPVILSVAGLSVAENIEMLTKIQDSNFNGLTELNLSCPNVIGKPQLAYDFEATEEILTAVFKFFKKPLGVKLPPYFDLVHFDQMANILNKFPLSHVNSINSIGNGLWIDTDTEAVVIKPKNGFGGVGGAYVLPTALANVRAFRTRLNPNIKLIGTGGVTTGADVFAHLLCGADLIAVGTQLQVEGPQVFTRLMKELSDIMQAKNYTDVAEFRGKLQTL